MSTKHEATLGRRIRWRLEWWGFLAISRLIPLLSRRSVVGLARIAGRVAYRLARRERRIALANLELAFGATMTLDARSDIARRSFETFALTALDYFWFSRHRDARLRQWVVLHGDQALWARKTPVVAVTAHYGNWEVMGLVLARNGVNIASVAKPVKNPLVDAEINRVRTLSGQRILQRDGALRGLVRTLKESGTIALLLDQDTLPSDGGAFVPFFGVPVPVSLAGAGLALKFKAPLHLAFCSADEHGVYHAVLTKILEPEDFSGLDDVQLTVRITGYLEDHLRTDPAPWLWSYKRWKRRQPGIEPSRYPFYADC